MSDLGWKYLTRSDKKLILKGIRDGVAYGGPYHVEIHPADRCNIECFFCSTAALRGTDEFPLTRFEELLGELKLAGTRSIRLSGGGEPLFHREGAKFIGAIAASGIPIENLTTNAVLLSQKISDLLVGVCDQVTVSINTADAETWSTMMKSPARNFDRVLANIRGLVQAKRAAVSKTPQITLQFLVWKGNFRTIPQMYALASDLGVDSIMFNGLSFLSPEQKMSESETAEMMGLYKNLVRLDKSKLIGGINSFEQDLSVHLATMYAELAPLDPPWGAAGRAVALLMRADFRTIWAKIQWKLAKRRPKLEEFCIIGWHSMLIRSSGSVAACCILQGSDLANVFKHSISEVWAGPAYKQFRNELADIIRKADDWKADPATHRTVGANCGKGTVDPCPIRSFYYSPDADFLQDFNQAIPALRQPLPPMSSPQ
ncbi:MAG TPA: radical SAM protein [Thermoanaerobaculia bacterium]|nr:radical SAM protein [Thermoanaerobaculia bacterium]